VGFGQTVAVSLTSVPHWKQTYFAAAAAAGASGCFASSPGAGTSSGPGTGAGFGFGVVEPSAAKARPQSMQAVSLSLTVAWQRGQSHSTWSPACARSAVCDEPGVASVGASGAGGASVGEKRSSR